MNDQDPSVLRKVYFDAWQKNLNGNALTQMEAIIVDIIQRHPEYHPFFSTPEKFSQLQNEKFALDHNPFFHLALHVTIAEQVGANKPTGIKDIYWLLMKKYEDQTKTEHKMMECLAKVLVESFNKGESAQEEAYLLALRQLL